jgi:hypothetical protein
MLKEKEFGDFQTPLELAGEVVSLISEKYGTPDSVIEPTCGLGSFIDAAHGVWGDKANYIGYEINPEYCIAAEKKFHEIDKIEIEQRDILTKELPRLLPSNNGSFTLIIGNPPWVTNSALGTMNSDNLPVKSNFQGLRGFDAKTGKANFDIAEWIIIRLFENMPQNAVLAMLCKTATARRVLLHLWNLGSPLGEECLYLIDAKKSFDVAVDACLLVLCKAGKSDKTAVVFENLHSTKPQSRFGIINTDLIANIDNYRKFAGLDGYSQYKWRSGIKHDAARIMELTPVEGGFKNGLGEIVELESDYVYPLLKSSDLGNGRSKPRRWVIVPQRKVGQDTAEIETSAPKTWAYLEKHTDILDSRNSSIYNTMPRWSVFGIGEYSFSMWKVAISGLYKRIHFVTVPPFEGKPTMLDDTCYFIPCGSEEEAEFWQNELNSVDCIEFLSSLVFFDAKRPVSIDILRRIDFSALAGMHGVLAQAKGYLSLASSYENSRQTELLFSSSD